MKTTITIEKEVDIKRIHMDLAVRYEEEDMPNDYPFRHGDMWSIDVDIDSGQIKDWPAGVPARQLYMKVTDNGAYFLYDDEGKGLASIENDYVPHGVVPGEFGDYIEFDIDATGVITNWPKNPSFEDFFPN